ncbi:MAG: helix-turn-helix domain-containing protein [Clostridiales bacterium]
MLLSLLLKRLRRQSYKIISKTDIDTEIYGIKMLTSNQSIFSSEILYFGLSRSLSDNIKQNKLINFLGYGSITNKIRKLCEQNQNNISFLNDNIDPFEAYNILQDCFLEENETSSKVKRMLSALLSNNGIDYLIDETYKVLGNPIFIVDNNYRYIAKNIGADKINPDSLYRRIITQEIAENGVNEEGRLFIKKNNLDEILSKTSNPFYFYNEVFKKGSMLLTIRVHNIEVGHMMLLEEFKNFTTIDYECFLKLSYFVAQELQKNSFYINNKGQMFSYFLIDLLKSEFPSIHNINRRLSILKYQLLNTFYICIISTQQKENPHNELSILIQQLQNILTGHIYAIYNNQLVILFNKKNNSELSNYCISELKKTSIHNKIKIGLSNPFDDITLIKTYYKQAVRTIEYINQLNKYYGLYYYKDYTYYDILNNCQANHNLLNFCDPDLMILLKYDKKRSSNLMTTLYHFLEESANSKLTSKALFIHKNTLHYRLDKIKSILSNPLTSGDSLFKYHLSFRILIYLGLFNPEIKKNNSEN